MLQPDSNGKTCGTATALGYVTPGETRTIQGTIDAAGVQDWFTVSFVDGSILSLTVQNVPPAGDLGSDFQLEVYSACGLPMIATAQGGELKQLTLGANDPHTVFLCVSATRWEVRSATFEVTLSAQPAIKPPSRPVPTRPAL